VTAIHDQYRSDKEKCAALEKWAEVVTEIVDVKPAPRTLRLACRPGEREQVHTAAKGDPGRGSLSDQLGIVRQGLDMKPGES
jgi:hypothetical protein